MERTRNINEPLLKGLQVTNFKAFSTPIEVPIRPITLIFGANSVGKSSLIQSLLLLKQTLEDKSNAALLPRGSEIDLGSFYEFVHRHELERSVSFKITTRLFDPEQLRFLDETERFLLSTLAQEDDQSLALKFSFTYQKDIQEIICSSLELFAGSDLEPLAIFAPHTKNYTLHEGEKAERQETQQPGPQERRQKFLEADEEETRRRIFHEEAERVEAARKAILDWQYDHSHIGKVNKLVVTKVNHEHSIIQRMWESEIVNFKKLLLQVLEKEGGEVTDIDRIASYFPSMSSRERQVTDYTIESFAQEFVEKYSPLILDHFLPDSMYGPQTRANAYNSDDSPVFLHLQQFSSVARKHLDSEIFTLLWPDNNTNDFLFNISLKKDAPSLFHHLMSDDTDTDTKTIKNLARTLWSRQDLVSQYLYERLTAATQKSLAKAISDSDFSEALLSALSDELNGLIKGPSLYEATVGFQNTELSPQTKLLLKKKPTGDELIILNRLLLEDAYLRKIRKCNLKPMVTYTDLGNILTSFLPNEIAIYASKLLRKALSEIIYIGPLRQSPERFYTFQGAKTHQVGKSGERAFDLLWKNTETLAKVNKFLGELTQRYSLKLLPLQSSGDEVQEAFTIRLYDSALTHANIADVGFGISQVLPVIIQSAFSTGKVLCIEQPELHLHPGAQAELGDLFIDSALTQSNTFIIETHSEHLLLRILRRIRETTENTLEEGQTPITPDDVQVVYAKYSSTGTQLYTLEVTPDGDFADKWPDGFFEERAGELF